MRLIPHFSILTLLLVVSVACLLAWLNTRETITQTEPCYAPLMGVARHPPPYHIKEMCITFHVQRGWPIWHARSSHTYRAHNAGWDFVDGWPTHDVLLETDYFRVGTNACIGLFILIAAGVVSEFFARRLGSVCRPTLHARRAESPWA